MSMQSTGAYYYPNQPMNGLGAYYVAPPQSAIQIEELSNPSAAVFRHLRNKSIKGIGQEGTDVALGAGLGVGVIVGLIAIAVAVNYQIGKALAPNKQSEAKWAWGNAIGGTLLPPVTLGMAVYKNYFI